MNYFIGICITGFLATLSYFLSRYPVLPLYAESLGLSSFQTGLVVSASSLTGVFFKLQMGTLSDVFGRRKMLILSLCFFAFTPFLYLVFKDATSLFILRLMHGFATAIFAPVISAIISDIATEKNRGQLLSSFSSASMSGEMIGPMICGWILFIAGFYMPFFISGCVGIAALLFFLIFVNKKDSEPPFQTEKKRFGFLNGLKKVFSNKAIILVSLVECGQFFTNGALECFLPIYAKNHVHLLSWQIGLLMGISVFMTIFFKPFWGTLSDIFGRKLQISFGLVLGGISCMLIPTSHSFPIILLFIALYGFAIAIVTSSTSPFITDLVTKESYGSAHGTFGTITDIGHASGAILGGLLIAGSNYDLLFILFGGFLLAFGLIFRVLINSFRL